MKAIAVFLLIHILAFRIALAQTSTSPGAVGVSFQGVSETADECSVLLPTLESRVKDVETEYLKRRAETQAKQENYMVSFNQVTDALFKVTEAREHETQKLSENRDGFRMALRSFDQIKTTETSKALQENYTNLTLSLFAALNASQKTLEFLKVQLGHFENARSVYLNSQTELEALDHQKLNLEGRLVSLKIRCQPMKRF